MLDAIKFADGTFSSDSFHFAMDGNGGTLITEHAGVPPQPMPVDQSGSNNLIFEHLQAAGASSDFHILI